MKEKEAIDHIIEQGTDSRTIMFNATMGAIGAFLTAVVVIIDNKMMTQLSLPTMTLVSALGNVYLYGLTHKKRLDGGYKNV